MIAHIRRRRVYPDAFEMFEQIDFQTFYFIFFPIRQMT